MDGPDGTSTVVPENGSIGMDGSGPVGRPRKVLVAVPNQGWIHKTLTIELLRLLRTPGIPHEVSFNFDSQKPIDHNRNAIVKEFLASDCEFLVTIDDDNPPHPANPTSVVQLVEHDLDIIGLPTPIWWNKRGWVSAGKDPIVWNAFIEREGDDGRPMWDEHPRQAGRGLQEVDAMGSGCLVIARRVLEHPDMRAPFQREWDVDGLAVRGSDLMFCHRAKRAGFRIWCDYDNPCRHVKEQDLVEINQILHYRDIRAANRPNINTPEYWDGQWATRPERILPFYEQIAAKLRGQRVLDFGCGRGDLLAMLGPNAVGCDISLTAVEICRSRGLDAFEISGLSIELGSISKVTRQSDPAPGDAVGMVSDVGKGKVFDAIVLSEVLEHVDDDRALIETLWRYTDRLIVSVPNNCLPPGLEPEHRRVYTAEDLRMRLPEAVEIGVWENYLLADAQRAPARVPTEV